MTIERCDRMWQVEALDDGRLESKDRASFERHSQTCAVCLAELAQLQELHRIMAGASAAERTDLERRRVRIALLRAANQRVLQRRAPSRNNVRVWALVAALPLLMLSAVALARYSLARASSGFEVVDVAQADWSAKREGTTSRVTLRAGVASFHVEHVAIGARFLVMLPDGEIEVRGTRFVVDVGRGQTRSVLVTEGVVALRIGGTEHLLHASDRWQRDDEAPARPATTALATQPATATPEPEASSIAPASAKPTDRFGAVPTAGAPQLGTSAVSSARASRASADTSELPEARNRDKRAGSAEPTLATAGARFAQAVAAFSAGDYGRADTLFGAFARDFANDSRAEDATFLCADARARRGDKAGAAAGARAYLRAYPNGLRRPAAERLAENL